MKKLSLLLTAVMMVHLFAVPTVFADDEQKVFLNYDFEQTWAGKYPDENWSALNSNFEAANDDYGKALKIRHYGEPILKFGQTLKNGKLHVSFDVKIMSEYRNLMPVLYDGRLGENPDAISYDDGQVSKAFRINSYTNNINWFQDGTSILSMTAWKSNDINITDERFNSFFPEGTVEKKINGQWYHCDIVTTEMSESDARADYYINGVKINDNPVYFAGSKGFKGIGFRTEGFKGDADDTEDDKLNYQNDGYVLVDNVRVTRYWGDEGIEGSVSGKVPLTPGAMIDVELSESVDVSLLTKENITITNAASGAIVTDFEVSNATQTGFTLTFTNVLPSGNYELMLSDTIIGGNLNYKMINPVEFRTEYKTQQVNTVYANFDFNNYTYIPPTTNTLSKQTMGQAEDNTTMPDGWRNIGQISTTYSQSVSGKSGDEGDVAWGFINPEKKSEQSRFIYTFDNPIPALSEYEISFDIHLQNMNWFLYLLEQGDDNANTAGYDENVAIGSTANSGLLFYAHTRRKTPNTKINNLLKVEPEGWHSIKLKVKPRLDENTSYIVSVDGGTEYTISTGRSFDTNSTIGIGIGYAARQEFNGHMYIDNVKVVSDMNVLFPEIDRITYYNYDDSEVEVGDEMSTLIGKINIDFNTSVDAGSARDAIRVVGGTELSYDIDFTNTNGKSSATINLDRLLEKNKNYRITVSPGIKSAYTSQVSSEVAVNKSFGTRQDLAFRMFHSEMDSVRNKYVVKFVKNNNQSGKYTFAVAGYKNVTKNIDGVPTNLCELVGIEYIPIEITSDTKGILEYDLNTNFNEMCDVYKPFIWTYPQQLKMELGDLNAVLN